jgi:hypothetical protein
MNLTQRSLRLLCVSALIFLVFRPSHAERIYHMGSSLDLYSGFSNSLGSQAVSDFSPYYHASPSIDLATEGRAFNFTSSYTFTFDRYQQKQDINTKSHAANLKFDSQLSRKVKLSLENGFYTTPDYITYSLSRGIIFTGDHFEYLYQSQKQSQTTDSSRLSLDVAAGKRSSLSLTIGSSLRNQDGAVAGRSNDQIRYEGSLAFRVSSSQRQSWTAKYSAVRNQYDAYGNSLAHSGLFGFTRSLKPSVSFSLEAGPSYVVMSRENRHYWGYSGTARISKTTRSTQLSFYGGRRSGDSSGTGSTSDTDNIGLGFILRLSKNVNTSFTGAAYRSQYQETLTPNTRGVNGGLQLSWALSRHYVLGGGISYRTSQGSGESNRDYRQAYVSFRLQAPDFWKGAR